MMEISVLASLRRLLISGMLCAVASGPITPCASAWRTLWLPQSKNRSLPMLD